VHLCLPGVRHSGLLSAERPLHRGLPGVLPRYDRVAVIHIPAEVGGEELRAWKREINTKLLGLEREVFLAGFHKAIVLFAADCSLCPDDCVPDPRNCRHPRRSRPTPEALGVDVFGTVRKLGYPIEVLTDRSQLMNRYAFLLVE